MPKHWTRFHRVGQEDWEATVVAVQEPPAGFRYSVHRPGVVEVQHPRFADDLALAKDGADGMVPPHDCSVCGAWRECEGPKG